MDPLATSLLLSLALNKNFLVTIPDGKAPIAALLNATRRVGVACTHKHIPTAAPSLFMADLGTLLETPEEAPYAVYLTGLETASPVLQAALGAYLRRKERGGGDSQKHKSGTTPVMVAVCKTNSGNGLALPAELVARFFFKHIVAEISPTNTTEAEKTFRSQLEGLRRTVDLVRITPEIHRYYGDIILHTRNHRLVQGGIPFMVFRDFELLLRAVSALHGYAFATPRMVKLVAMRLLPLRFKMLDTLGMEPSLKWGSEKEMVDYYFQNMNPDLIVSGILMVVNPPI